MKNRAKKANMARANRKRAAQGFSLSEALLALLIVSLAANLLVSALAALSIQSRSLIQEKLVYTDHDQ